MFPYNILLNIKSGITPVKSRDSATLFLFNCRRWDYTNCQNICQTVFQKFPNRILIRTGLGIFAYSQQFDDFCHRIVTKNAFRICKPLCLLHSFKNDIKHFLLTELIFLLIKLIYSNSINYRSISSAEKQFVSCAFAGILDILSWQKSAL